MTPPSALHAPANRPLDLDRLAAAVSRVENGFPFGLGGRSCISREVWRQHTRQDYELSRTPFFCLQVEAMHLRWIIDRLNHAGIVAAPDTIYCSWRYGVTGAIRLIRSGMMPECCQRAANLYFSSR